MDNNIDRLIDLEDQPSRIKSREDFVIFLKKLLINYKKSNEDWENDNLESFIDGMIGATEDADGYYKNLNEDLDADQPSWRLFADILISARVYE